MEEEVRRPLQAKAPDVLLRLAYADLLRYAPPNAAAIKELRIYFKEVSRK